MTYGSAWAQKAVVWVVSTDSGAVYREVADVLRAEVERVQPGSVEWVDVPPQQIPGAGPAPRLVVTIGSGALAAVTGNPRSASSPILATLLPRAAFDREISRAGQRLDASAILLDQPPARQAALIRAALPKARQVGFLLGPESRKQALVFRNALEAQGLTGHFEDAGERGVFAALQSLLEDSDVLLALPDPAVFNSESIANVLTSAYRRKVPLVAFSPSYVRAGALLGMYAAPGHVARAGAEAVRSVLSGAPLPLPAAPRDYAIDVNTAVARSLGLVLDEAELRRRMATRLEKP